MTHAYDYPNEPGHRGIETSIEAANAIAPVQGRLQRMAFRAIRNAGGEGMTAQELADDLRIDRGAIQPRTTELRRLGMIDDSGQRRLNPSGKRAIVWIATKGEQSL